MTRIQQLAEDIRDTHEPMRIEGSGTWLHGGGPWAPAAPLHTRHLGGVVEYEPGDLVITVGAGTTLEELGAITGEHGQMLALAPFGETTATVGAAVATATSGPLTYGDYTMRDLVLGLQVITGAGDITRVGGRVVKNVAGFDLVRLHTGAHGTLGVITEVSLRLHARPAVDAVYRGTIPNATVGGINDLIPRLVAQRAPLPMLLRFAPDTEPQLWARISGNTARAAALRQQILAFGIDTPAVESPGAVHDMLRRTPHDAVVLRARTQRSDAVPFVKAALDAFPLATHLYDPASGSLRVIIPPTAAGAVERDIATWYRLAAAGGAMHTMSVVIDQGRPAATPRIPLDEGIKRALDPRDVLNRLAPVHATSLAHPDV